METYPIIIVPDIFFDIKKNIKKLLSKKFEKTIFELPNAPKQPAKVEFTFSYTIFIAFFISGGFYILTKNSSISNITFIIGLFVYPIIYLIQLSNYDSAKHIYDIAFKVYQKKSTEITIVNNQIKYENLRLEQNLTDINWVIIEGQKLINDRLLPKKSAKIEFLNPQIGKSELFFLIYLNKYFPFSIFRNKAVEIFQNNYYEEEKAYSPDFILVHTKTNLTLDIEIDEPYNKDDMPIHTLNNKHDQKRNEYFSKLNWVIIRFSERQIRIAPEACCYEIAKLIYDITGDLEIISQFTENKGISKDRIWTHQKAVELAKESKRSNYERFEEKLLNFNINSLFDTWECNNFIYKFESDFTFLETAENSNNITDDGHFTFDKSDHTKISVFWKEGPTDYELTQLDKQTILFTELPKRTQFIFKKLGNTSTKIKS